MIEPETPFRTQSKPWPRHWFLRFVKGARLNYRIGAGLGPSVRVAWFDARRYQQAEARRLGGDQGGGE